MTQSFTPLTNQEKDLNQLYADNRRDHEMVNNRIRRFLDNPSEVTNWGYPSVQVAICTQQDELIGRISTRWNIYRNKYYK